MERLPDKVILEQLELLESELDERLNAVRSAIKAFSPKVIPIASNKINGAESTYKHKVQTMTWKARTRYAVEELGEGRVREDLTPFLHKLLPELEFEAIRKRVTIAASDLTKEGQLEARRVNAKTNKHIYSIKKKEQPQSGVDS